MSENIVRQAKKFPETNALLDYLNQRNAMPDVEALGTLSGASGEFQFANRPSLPKQFHVTPRGKIRMQSGEGANTFIHELTHAAEFQIIRQVDEATVAGVKNQFTDAYSKMKGSRAVDTLAPNLKKDTSAYRANPMEVNAFAVADAAVPEERFVDQKGIPPHLNATMATEFMILLDLASRAEADKTKPAAKKPKLTFKQFIQSGM